MIKRILLYLSVLIVAGCSPSKEEPRFEASNSDALPQSSCANCTLKPFYVDGHWIERIKKHKE